MQQQELTIGAAHLGTCPARSQRTAIGMGQATEARAACTGGGAAGRNRCPCAALPRRLLLWVLLSWLVLATGGAGAGPMVQSLIDELSASDYQGYVESLEDFGTRYYNTAGNEAARGWLSDTFESFGLDVRQDPYTHGGATRYNVEATLPGLTDPDRILIIGAHFDSISNQSSVLAPGADDNATGVAALLEAASVLSRYGFASTIRFVAFNSEEQGLVGSQAYATSAKARGTTSPRCSTST